MLENKWDIGGRSSPRGLKLYSNKISVQSKGYKSNTLFCFLVIITIPLPFTLISFLITDLVRAELGFNYKLDFFFQFLPLYLMLGCITIVGLILLHVLFNKRKLAQWHAAEHMVINFLEREKMQALETLKAENLANSSMFSDLCGDGNHDLNMPSKKQLEIAAKVGKKIIPLITK